MRACVCAVWNERPTVGFRIHNELDGLVAGRTTQKKKERYVLCWKFSYKGLGNSSFSKWKIEKKKKGKLNSQRE